MPDAGLDVVVRKLGHLAQAFGAGRHLSALDVGIDATGALIALVATGIIRSRRSEREGRSAAR